MIRRFQGWNVSNVLIIKPVRKRLKANYNVELLYIFFKFPSSVSFILKVLPSAVV